MMENFEIPLGSKIQQTLSDRGQPILYWSRSGNSIIRYVIGAFIASWLGGWFFAFKNAVRELIQAPDAPNSEFLKFWLAGWTLGGCFALFYLYLLFRPQKPESIVFHPEHLEYDTGTFVPTAAVTRYSLFQRPAVRRNTLFRKRKIFPMLRKNEIQFIYEKNPSRVYFDFESTRYEIGAQLSEPDIDWLHAQLRAWEK